jgi:hypothetical protein
LVSELFNAINHDWSAASNNRNHDGSANVANGTNVSSKAILGMERGLTVAMMILDRAKVKEGSLGQGTNDIPNLMPWILIGAAGGVALYFIIRSYLETVWKANKPGETWVAPLPPALPPSRFATLESVEVRFGQLKELYRMGYKSPEETIAELNALSTATQLFPAEAEDARALQARIESFKAEVEEFIRSRALTLGLSSAWRSGQAFPILNVPRR